MQQRPQAKKLAKAYKTYYGSTSLEEIGAPTGVAQAYDAVHLLARAINQAGTTRPAALRKALENLPPYEGAVKTYAPAFTSKRRDTMGMDDFFMAKFRHDGLIVPVEAAKE